MMGFRWYDVVIGLLLLAVIVMNSKIKELEGYVNNVTTTLIDSVIVKETDTIYVVKPKLVESTITDTFVIIINDTSISLPVEQRVYSDSTYTAWVSGINPTLDSLTLFQSSTTIYKTIETTQTIPDVSSKVFAGIGLDVIDKSYVPKVGVAYQKKKFMVGADLGLYDKQVIYGLNVKYKIK